MARSASASPAGVTNPGAACSIRRAWRRRALLEIDAFLALLRKYGVALAVADTAGKFPQVEDVTADFMYVRLHGEHELYASGYEDDALERWASKIRAWREGGRDVYCYFDNDIKVRAPFDAKRLMELLGLSWP